MTAALRTKNINLVSADYRPPSNWIWGYRIGSRKQRL